MEQLITPHIWLQPPIEIRLKLAKDFGLNKSGSPTCVTQGGITHVESDGHTIDDLRKINLESMREYLGLDDGDNLLELFELCVEKAKEELSK